MRNLRLFVILLAIFMCASTQVLVAMPENNCLATILNRDVFQPGESLVVRILPFACSPAAIDLQMSVQKADQFTQKWVEVARRTARLRGLTEGVPVMVTTVPIPDGESEFAFGFYRIVLRLQPDPIGTVFAYDETPMFYIGNPGLNPAVGTSVPAERISMMNLSLGEPVLDNNSFRFTGRLGDSRVIALFYQFREENSVATYRTVLQRETDRAVSVSLPGLFTARLRDGHPIWVHLVDPNTGVAIDRQLRTPTNLWEGLVDPAPYR